MPFSNPITIEHDARVVMPIGSCSEAIRWTQPLHFSPAMQALAEKLVLEWLLNSWVLTYVSPQELLKGTSKKGKVRGQEEKVVIEIGV